MSNKKEDIFIQSMRISFVIILIMVIFFPIIQYIYITDEPNSISKFSALFTFISSMGIAVGFIVYALQKNDKKKEFNQKFKHYCNVISEEKEKIIELYKKLEEIEKNLKEIKDEKLEYITLRFRKDAYTFIIKKSNYEDKKLHSFFINSTIIQMMSQTCNDSLKISHDLYLPLKKLIDETITLERRLYAVFLRFDAINEKTDNIGEKERRKMLKYELFTKRTERLKKINKIIAPTLH